MLALDQQALERRSLARNEALFRQGDKVTAIYFIETGRLELPPFNRTQGYCD
jgi:CRP-like cAMP-binding protein